MAAKAQAKNSGYEVRRLTGTMKVYRGGEHVGDHPEAGYQVIVPGRGTALAGTEVAAHAMAEIMKDVVPYRRRFVLTEAEYDEHREILRRNLDALLERFPYSEEEAAAVRASNERYASVIEKGEAKVRRALMNLSAYESIETASPRRRPELPPLDAVRVPGM